jgi:hypothetical protein
MHSQVHHLTDVRPLGRSERDPSGQEALVAALNSEAVRDLVFSFLRIDDAALRQAALGAVRAAEAASRIRR